MPKLGAYYVSAGYIATGAVTAPKLGAASVTTAAVATGGLNLYKIATTGLATGVATGSTMVDVLNAISARLIAGGL